jgi:DNA polymerase-3 subunit gamma/tau
MAYQVLARKWRPQDFESVVGQEPIVTARVLAKALNCERGPAADPCNECTACLEITAGSDLDVIEVDAATYSKVEQVRELTEGLKYGPARDRYKVVVIDEIHRLSRQAFDALLKIIEEPPPHLVFIFATTEIDAVPATVLSRCQELHFRRVPSQVLATHLRAIAESEEIETSDAALRLIARAGEGSVRDSVALLDQLATFGSGTIADQDAVRLLGGLDTALFERLLGAVLAGERAAISEVVAEIESEGWDPRHVYAQFLAYCRDAIHLAMGTDPDRVDLPREEADRLAERSREAGFENLLRLLQQLLASEETVRRSDSALLAVEIAWLRAAELPRLTRVEALLAGGPLPASPRQGAKAGRTAPARPRDQSAPPARSAAPAPPPTGEPPPVQAPPATTSDRAETPAPAPRPAAPAAPKGSVDAFLEQVGVAKPPLAGHLRQAQALRFQGGRLEVEIEEGDDLLWNRLQKGANREIVDRAVATVWGADAHWSAVRGGPAPPPSRETAEEPAAGAEPPNSPTVQTVLEIFQDTVERVEADPAPDETHEES